jgi:hypothetical protein
MEAHLSPPLFLFAHLCPRGAQSQRACPQAPLPHSQTAPTGGASRPYSQTGGCITHKHASCTCHLLQQQAAAARRQERPPNSQPGLQEQLASDLHRAQQGVSRSLPCRLIFALRPVPAAGQMCRSTARSSCHAGAARGSDLQDLAAQ